MKMARFDAWWRWARQWRQARLVDTIDRVAVLENVHDGGALGPRYAFMIVMACGIAMLGLLQNSVAVIIGAMLISPLMGPIISSAWAWPRSSCAASATRCGRCWRGSRWHWRSRS
ncbi:MAG: hypothetical protein IPO74_11370 [Thermomonas sp.]|nr:hypothetical protein [Thermomonas sp.]